MVWFAHRTILLQFNSVYLISIKIAQWALQERRLWLLRTVYGPLETLHKYLLRSELRVEVRTYPTVSQRSLSAEKILRWFITNSYVPITDKFVDNFSLTSRNAELSTVENSTAASTYFFALLVLMHMLNIPNATKQQLIQ